LIVPAALSVVLRLGVADGRLSPLVALGLATGGAIANRGVWFWAKPGVHPKSGKRLPHPTIRYCCTIEYVVKTIQ